MSSPTAAELADLAQSWRIALEVQRKSTHTLTLYMTGVRLWLEWSEAHALPPLARSTVNAYGADLLAQGKEANTVRSRLAAVRAFARWLAAEGELETNPLANLAQPKLDQKLVEPLTEDQLRDMLRQCAGRTFADRRDTAIIRFMAETGARAGEVMALTVDDVNIPGGVAVIRRGKGAKGRTVPFGPVTAQALDRYVRARRTHRLAHTPALWLGVGGKTFGYSGLLGALKVRAAAAGVPNFHPHVLRHTAAHRWLAAGGSEDGLRTIAGWSKPEMLQRYTRARASDRAAAEARALRLGDY